MSKEPVQNGRVGWVDSSLATQPISRYKRGRLLLFFSSSPPPAVLYGDVYRVRVLWGPLAGSFGALLAGHLAHPVLDRWRDLLGHA